MEVRPTLAFGLDLHLRATAEGGRHTALLGGHAEGSRFNYRPNWGLPGMTPPEQTGGPVFGFSRENIAPGDRCRAVIVAIFFAEVPLWSEVRPGADLPMYEGSKVCGVGHVVWRVETRTPLPATDADRFVAWLEGRADQVR